MKISQDYLHNMLILLENIFRVANNLPSRVDNQINGRFPCYLVGKALGFEKYWVIPNEGGTITHAQSILISDVFLIVTEQPYL